MRFRYCRVLGLLICAVNERNPSCTNNWCNDFTYFAIVEKDVVLVPGLCLTVIVLIFLLLVSEFDILAKEWIKDSAKRSFKRVMFGLFWVFMNGVAIYVCLLVLTVNS